MVLFSNGLEFEVIFLISLTYHVSLNRFVAVKTNVVKLLVQGYNLYGCLIGSGS